MAYAAVLTLTQILQEIKDPGRDVLHEKQQIGSLQEKVSFLQDFFENYSVCADKVVKELEIKIRDAAYEAEDIIESYVSTSILSKSDGGNSTEGFQTFCRDLDRVIEETHSIQQEAMKIKHILDQKYVQKENHLPINRSRLGFSDRPPHMVGLVEDTMKIKDWLTSSSSDLEVISIVGMGGIGKTTFAKNLFDDSLIVYNFDVRAWVTVSQEYRMHEIFAGLLDSTNKLGPDMRKVSSEELAERLYKSLKGKRYLIVMDDMWDTKVWDDVKRFFPDDDNGSRIVLTSRLTNVGVYAAPSDHLHDMSFLSSSESWKLFCEIVFRRECCPLSLEGIGREIVKNCEGLPLSIVVVGGLLSKNKRVSYWETIATTLNSILATFGGQCSTIFSLSYNHLPAHLKPCFLYFATFPEDCVIQRSKLIRLWIAEGFIRPDESKNLEDKAEEYLEDLTNRSLIMVHQLGRCGNVKSYGIHDLLRDFCTTQVRKENFLHVPDRYTPTHRKGIKCERRVSIHPNIPLEDYIDYIHNSDRLALLTRSFQCFHSCDNLYVSKLLVGFRLLRILDLAEIQFNKFPIEIVRLVHLRYLSLYCCNVMVPESISSIWGLQTLVIDTLEIFAPFYHLPLQVWKMPHLRHVRICCQLPDPPNSEVEDENFVILANLQTLSKIRNFRFTDEIIKRIPKLKKLEVFYDIEFEDWSHIHLSNMTCLNELETLKISSDFKIAFPPNFKFPVTLRKLALSGSYLRWEDLTMVGSLRNLEVLMLQYYACEGEVWEPNEGEFRELKCLELCYLDLVHWRADDSHFPKLKFLKIDLCFKLKEIPIEFGNTPTLELIELDDNNPSAVASAKLIVDEQRSFGNDVLQVRVKNHER